MVAPWTTVCHIHEIFEWVTANLYIKGMSFSTKKRTLNFLVWSLNFYVGSIYSCNYVRQPSQLLELVNALPSIGSGRES